MGIKHKETGGKRPFWLTVFIVLLLVGCVHTGPGRAESGGKIRVLVLKGTNVIDIKGSDAGSIQIRRAGQGRVTVNGIEKYLPLRFYPEREVVYLNGRPYIGTLEVYDGSGSLLVVNELYLEAYLVGIINNEISAKWPGDVVKTQAVIARTYALNQKRKRAGELYHIEGSILGQVYSGVDTEDAEALRAVRSTHGEILAYNGEPALTVYHSNAGGMTDSAKDVWSMDYPYLKSVESPFDNDSRTLTWDFALSAGSLRKLLSGSGYNIGEPADIYPEDTTRSGRVRVLVIKDADGRRVRLTGEDFRKIVGYSAIKSALFKVERSGDIFIFKGRGSGHGVGLSQWGAKGMSEKGYSYREILRHFYPGTSLLRAY